MISIAFKRATRTTSLRSASLAVSSRYYSDKPKYRNVDDVKSKLNIKDTSDKFSSIDAFNKLKTDYLFGDLDNTKNLHERLSLQNPLNVENDLSNINSIIEKDPRLINLKPGSPEYKYQVHLIHEEHKQRQEKEGKRFELNERLRAIGAGFGLMLSIAIVHQVVMNYEYLKSKVNAKLKFRNVDDSKASDLTDPAKNTKNIDYLVNKMSEEMEKNPEIVKGLVSSTEKPGLYLFGEFNKKKLPIRVDAFNDMYIKDVKILKNYLVVVDSNGQVYHYTTKMKEPVKVSVPGKVVKVDSSNNTFYYLNNKGEVYYSSKLNNSKSAANVAKGWFLNSTTSCDKLSFEFNRGERVKDISCGQGHILALSTSGRLFAAKTYAKAINYGQFGLPQYSPFNDAEVQTLNEPFELTNLNYEILTKKDGSKVLQNRIFTSIATGFNHNIASDSNNNIWTWGSNRFGECGEEITYRTDVKPIPKKILGNDDFNSITAHLLPGDHHWVVEKVLANEETSLLQLKCIDEENEAKNQTVLLSFGNGIKGQLGNSRFLHVCSKPQVVKPFLGLTEFNELENKVTNIGIKDISLGNNHTFVTLNNFGSHKDILTFGDNEAGQFGNGKIVKSCKPVKLPKLIEPEDFPEEENLKQKKKLARRLNNVINSRLQLLHDIKVGGKKVEQVVVAGENSSALFYRLI